MTKLYLMQRFDMNQGFPHPSPKGIEPYIGSSFVLFHESGEIIPLMERGFGNTEEISRTIAQRLRRYQDRGCEIRGDVHPFLTKPIKIDEDLEFYRPFPVDVASEIFSECGVNIRYAREAA